jgi:hypothetical protein
MDRSNHYESAFEGYLQAHRFGYVAVDETRRALLGEDRIKSLDFIVHGAGGARLLVDVKGRRFPGGTEQRRRVWECWSTLDDIHGLEQWARLFGPDYLSLFVFVYDVLPNVLLPDRLEDLWSWRGRRYLLRAVTADDYRRFMRLRSPRWGTVALPRAEYRRVVRPFCDYAGRPEAVALECPF